MKTVTVYALAFSAVLAAALALVGLLATRLAAPGEDGTALVQNDDRAQPRSMSVPF